MGRQKTSYLKRALAIREQALGTSHPDVASTLHDLAAAVLREGRHEAEALHKARPCYQRKGKGDESLLWLRLSTTWPWSLGGQGKYRDVYATLV